MYLPFSISPRAHIKLNSLFPLLLPPCIHVPIPLYSDQFSRSWVRLRCNPNCYIKRVTPIVSRLHPPRYVKGSSPRSSCKYFFAVFCCSSMIEKKHACNSYESRINYIFTIATKGDASKIIPTTYACNRIRL